MRKHANYHFTEFRFHFYSSTQVCESRKENDFGGGGISDLHIDEDVNGSFQLSVHL